MLTANDLILFKVYGYSAFGELVDLLGLPEATKFIKIFGGTKIKIPSFEELQKIKLEHRIYMDCIRGIKKTQLATKYGMSMSKIIYIQKKMEKVLGHAEESQTA